MPDFNIGCYQNTEVMNKGSVYAQLETASKTVISTRHRAWYRLAHLHGYSTTVGEGAKEGRAGGGGGGGDKGGVRGRDKNSLARESLKDVL